MEKSIKSEDINFTKLKLANINGRFLKTIQSDHNLLVSFVTLWNMTNITERISFVNYCGPSLKRKILHEVDILKLAEADISDCKYTDDDRTLNRIGLLSGTIKELAYLTRMKHEELSELISFINNLIDLIVEPELITENLIKIFECPLLSHRINYSFFKGEKYILSNELYASFEEELSQLYHNRLLAEHVRSDYNQFQNIVKLSVLLAIVLEDKILENIHSKVRLEASSGNEEDEYVFKEISNSLNKKEEILLMSLPAQHSKPSHCNHKKTPLQTRYMKIRNSCLAVDSTELVCDASDMKILGTFYSMNICHKMAQPESLPLIFNNFVTINQPRNRKYLEKVSEMLSKNINPKKPKGTSSRKDSQNSKPSRKTSRIQLGSDISDRKDGSRISAFSYKDKGDNFRNRFVSNHEATSSDLRSLPNQNSEKKDERKVSACLEKPKPQYSLKIKANPPSSFSRPLKKTLKATSSCYYHPDDKAKLHPNSKINDPVSEENLSLNLEELDFSTVAAWKVNSLNNNNEQAEDQRNLNFERFDYSENSSLLNLIDLGNKERMNSKFSDDVTQVVNDILPAILTSPRTEDSASKSSILKARLIDSSKDENDEEDEECPYIRIDKTMSQQEQSKSKASKNREGDIWVEYVRKEPSQSNKDMEDSRTDQDQLESMMKRRKEGASEAEKEPDPRSFPKLSDLGNQVREMTLLEKKQLYVKLIPPKKAPMPISPRVETRSRKEKNLSDKEKRKKGAKFDKYEKYEKYVKKGN